MSEEGMKALGEKDVKGEGLTEVQLAVVKYTDAMTRSIKVEDELFTELRKHFSEQEVVEITATVGLNLWNWWTAG